jgi:pimeloyl-ACP methyl ester carboxylesterase
VQCGTVSVPENYQQPDNTSLSINFAIIPAIDSGEKKPPFVFLAGGPGQAAVELASFILTTFDEVHKTHDIVLIDQRGTGKSHPLQCPESQLNSPYLLTPEEFSKQEVMDCLASFSGDLSQYSTENAINDFEQVRQALGYNKIHLYGGSYGTRAALIYMKRYPQALQTVVLDSVGPVEVPIGLFGQSGEQSFELLLAHCQQQPSCQRAFPDLKKEFNHISQQLKQQPATVSIPHPRLGTPTQFVISYGKLTSIIRMQLYNVASRQLVPEVIHQAFNGNYLPLAGLAAQLENGLPMMYMGLTFNIVCNEDFPRITPAMWQQDAENQFDGDQSHQAWLTACPLWPRYRPSPDFYQPVTASVPTLILSGALDPVTPPSNGDYPAHSLPNAKHIVVEQSAHIVASHSCAPEMIAEFLDQQDPSAINTECLQNVKAERFVTSLNGSL